MIKSEAELKNLIKEYSNKKNELEELLESNTLNKDKTNKVKIELRKVKKKLKQIDEELEVIKEERL